MFFIVMYYYDKQSLLTVRCYQLFVYPSLIHASCRHNMRDTHPDSVRIKEPSPRFWLSQTKPEVRGLRWQPKLISQKIVPILTQLTVVVHVYNIHYPRQRSCWKVMFYACMSFCSQGSLASQHASQVTWPGGLPQEGGLHLGVCIQGGLGRNPKIHGMLWDMVNKQQCASY